MIENVDLFTTIASVWGLAAAAVWYKILTKRKVDYVIDWIWEHKWERYDDWEIDVYWNASFPCEEWYEKSDLPVVPEEKFDEEIEIYWLSLLDKIKWDIDPADIEENKWKPDINRSKYPYIIKK